VSSVLQAILDGHPKDGVASSDLNKVTFSMDRPQNIYLKSVCKGELDYGCREGGAGLTCNSCSGLSGAPADAGVHLSVIMICRETFQYANLSPWNSVNSASFRCSIFQNGKNYAHRVDAGQPGMNVLGSTVFHGRNPGKDHPFAFHCLLTYSGEQDFENLPLGAPNMGAPATVGPLAVSLPSKKFLSGLR
jgi:hypothetical protein